MRLPRWLSNLICGVLAGTLGVIVGVALILLTLWLNP